MKKYAFFLLGFLTMFFTLQAQDFYPPPINTSGDWVQTFLQLITSLGATVIVGFLLEFARKKGWITRPPTPPTAILIFAFTLLFISQSMALPGINITLIDGQLGQTASSETHVNGLIIYADPDSVVDAQGMVNSMSDATASGITATSTTPYYPVLFYYLREIYRHDPTAQVYWRVITDPGTTDYNEIKQLQTEAEGKIRQFGIYVQKGTHTYSQIATNVQARLNELAADYKPAVAIVAPANITTYTSLPTLNDGDTIAPDVCMFAGAIYGDSQHFGAAQLRSGYLPSINAVERQVPYLGGALGMLSAANLHENIGWVDRFNALITSSEILPRVCLSSGEDVSTLSTNALEALHNKGWCFLRQFPNKAGAYINTDVTATEETSDYNSLRNNRVKNEAIRNLYRYTLPAVNSPIKLNTNGTMQPHTVAAYRTLGVNALEPLKVAGNVSDYQVAVSPTQNVLSNNMVIIEARILPIGCASYIAIGLGFAVSLT